MSEHRQNKTNQKEIIHTILMIIDPNPVTNQLRKRILNQRNSKDRLGIITPQLGQESQSDNFREVIFNVNLQDRSSLSQLIHSQKFDTVYIDLKSTDSKILNNVIKATNNTAVNHIILALSNNDQPQDIVNMIKHCNINYTIIRRAKLNNYDLLSYQTVHNAEPVNDSTVSPSSVADLTYQIIRYPKLQADTDLGIAQLPYK